MNGERWAKIREEGKTVVRVELDQETEKWLREKAKNEGKSKSQIMRDALRLLKQTEEGEMTIRGKLVTTSVQLEESDMRWLDELREKTGRSKTYWIREAVQMLRQKMEEEK